MSNFPFNQVAHALVQWFNEQGKDYPWRRTENPWSILVSEIMLQQTTIPTVLARYEAWMAQFPEPKALAEATEEEALRSWEGLGYYRRVRALQAAAKTIMERHGGQFPRTATDIRALPGVGDYTTGAVLSFAYNEPAPLVDANVARVFSRLFNYTQPVDTPSGQKWLWAMAAKMLHQSQPRAYNSALMELGQSHCSGGIPSCILCPVREWCQATKPEGLPIKSRRMQLTAVEHHDILCIVGQSILLEKQAGGKRHEGMYRLPRRTAAHTSGLSLLMKQKYSITRYKVTRYLYQETDAAPINGEEFIPLEELERLPLASPDRKCLHKVLPR